MISFFLIPLCQNINFLCYFKEKKPKDEHTLKILNFLGHSNRSSTSLEGDDDDELIKLEIIHEQVEDHRTLLLINEEDQILYHKIKEWYEKDPDCSLENTILEFGKKKVFSEDFGNPVAQQIYIKKLFFRS